MKNMNNSTIESEVSIIMYYNQDQTDRANQAGLVSFLNHKGNRGRKPEHHFRKMSRAWLVTPARSGRSQVAKW